MQKTSKENRSNPKLLDINNIIIAVILVILFLSLFVNFLILSKLSKIPDNFHSQGWHPVWGSSDGINGQEQELFLQMNPALDKIRHLQQQIMDREVIKDDSLIGVSIGNQLKEDIKEYNKLVPRLKGFFAEEALLTLLWVLHDEMYDGRELFALDYLEIPSDVREYAEIVADLSLYKNCYELLCNDSRLAFIIYVEGGGSAGRWPYIWHTEALDGHDDVKEDLNRLFDLVERIITSLDKEYENINYIKLVRCFPVIE